MPAVGIVADDLTGAADTGAAFLSRGLSTIVSWRGASSVPAADVLAIVTRSRAADAQFARNTVSRAASRFREADVAVLYKKIDSTLRGHIGVEVQAAIGAWHQGSLAIVAPAFPGTGRTTLDGIQRVAGEPVQGQASLPALLEQTGLATCLADIVCVRSAGLESMLRGCQQRPIGAVICDAETDDDLRAVVRAGVRLAPGVVWVGSGGLARAIAAESGAPVPRRSPTAQRVAGPILIVVGSTSDMARTQADDLAAAGVHRIVVPVTALDDDDGRARTAVPLAREVEAQLRAGRDCLLTLGSTGGQRRGDDPRLMMRLGKLLQPCAAVVAGLLLTGGDTAIGVLDAWGVTAIRLVEEFDPGVVVSEAIGPRALSIVSKAGSFGDRGTLTRAWERMRER